MPIADTTTPVSRLARYAVLLPPSADAIAKCLRAQFPNIFHGPDAFDLAPSVLVLLGATTITGGVIDEREVIAAAETFGPADIATLVTLRGEAALLVCNAGDSLRHTSPSHLASVLVAQGVYVKWTAHAIKSALAYVTQPAQHTQPAHITQPVQQTKRTRTKRTAQAA